MKLLGRLILATITVLLMLSLALPSFCPTVWADDGDDGDDCVPCDNVTVSLTIKILSRGGGGGGGGGGAWPSSCPYRLEVTMFGTVSWVSMTYDGKTCQKFEKTKKAVTLEIAKNTSCRDKDGKRLKELKVADCTGTIPSSDIFLIIDSYCLTSKEDGARFSPPIDLTFSYDPKDIPEGVAEKDLFVGYYADGKWNLLTSMVDTSKNTVATDVSHLTVFALMAEAPEEEVVEEEEEIAKEEEEPGPSPPAPVKGTNWLVVGLGIVGVIIVGIGGAYGITYWLAIRRRRGINT